MAKLATYTLVAALLAPHFTSALQVTPNSPCASACARSPTQNPADSEASYTQNSDIVCSDADYASPAGVKFQECMTCLQTSTFSQGDESDVMWFLYNMRYTAAYCIFGYPNATDVDQTPCMTSTACGHLQAAVEHGVPDPKGTTAYSYCMAGKGEAANTASYDGCIPCVSAERTTNYLANYFVALEAGCQQQPAPGVLLGLNATVFSKTTIGIVDPATIGQDDEQQGLGTAAIAGVVVAVVVLLLIITATITICLRKRRNRVLRAGAHASFFSRFSHVGHHRRSSMASFQCQTHMVSPRFWPGAHDGSTPVDDDTYYHYLYQQQQLQQQQQLTPDYTTTPDRSSIWKPPYEHPDDIASPETHTPPTTIDDFSSQKPAPLHITTTVPPTFPPQAHHNQYSSPSTTAAAAADPIPATPVVHYAHSPADFRSPMSAESVRSTAALLPQGYQHGYGHPAGGWPLSPDEEQMASHTPTTTTTPAEQSTRKPGERHIIKLNGPGITTTSTTSSANNSGVTVSFPPPPTAAVSSRKASRGSGNGGGLLSLVSGTRFGGGNNNNNNNNNGGGSGTGSPVESWEIQTAFAAPPRR
ncbi:hypothetical protein B0J18DRAFT_464127 [Chaetomium sp. MPI-SDFR-AT-0129]|nr:hypothetical protein B0J18DRAFT_464127 [Chaetomium sp. MPI-SDFR-AT-0129]